MATMAELEVAFWTAAASILAGIIKEPDKWIRWKHPTNGLPDWTVQDNVLFLNLSEREDQYAQQMNTLDKTVSGTVLRTRLRTRVWDLLCTAYGPDSYEIANKLKEGFMRRDIQALLGNSLVFYIPNLPRCVQVNEVYAGQWWERWDITLQFNEQTKSELEDVGHIDSLTLTARSST